MKKIIVTDKDGNRVEGIEPVILKEDEDAEKQIEEFIADNHSNIFDYSGPNDIEHDRYHIDINDDGTIEAIDCSSTSFSTEPGYVIKIVEEKEMRKKCLAIGYVEEQGRFYAETFVCDDESKIRDHAEEMLYVWGKLPILEADHYLIVSINDDGFPVVADDYSKNKTHTDKGVFLTKMR